MLSKSAIFQPVLFIKKVVTALAKPHQKIKPLVVIAPYGLSCVGKSTVMRVIAKRLPVIHLSNDELRLRLRQEGQSESLLGRYHFLEKIAQCLLEKGYSLILDANFASQSGHLERAERLVRKFKTQFYLIRVKAPKKFVIKKLKTKKWLPLDKGGLLATREEAVEHFLRSSQQYDYQALKSKTFLVVDASKPISPQLVKLIEKIKRESQLS